MKTGGRGRKRERSEEGGEKRALVIDEIRLLLTFIPLTKFSFNSAGVISLLKRESLPCGRRSFLNLGDDRRGGGYDEIAQMDASSFPPLCVSSQNVRFAPPRGERKEEEGKGKRREGVIS